MSGLVMFGLMVDQAKYGSGVVTYCRGPKLDQRMGELQWRTNTDCSARQKEIPDELENKTIQKRIDIYIINCILSIRLGM